MPEAVMELVKGAVNSEDASEVADNRNHGIVREARMAFLSLATSAAKHFITDKSSKGELADDYETRIFSYASAESKTAIVDDGLTVGCVILKGLEEFGEADSYSVIAEDDATKSQLHIDRLAEQVVSLDYNVEPLRDEQMERWAHILGPAFDKVFMVLSGRFEDEAGLDSKLNDIWLSFRGTFKEQEVGPVLDEIKDRAIATKDSIDLNVQFRLRLPSSQKLTEIASMLADK
ncbi:MAG TPA: hypothetical protein VK978_03950 [Candidatus Saccharimonadales bacterium]|nr:hypothetical protein [Candidatus Saccharimonadales bacterium]